ncbi:hypothetical protein OHC33_004746 [Knufia fluminis]|uniref:Uncharacterized protein n=1 Tax=Knufia fluminis TaxID=191047 RepID=A0AAN8ELN4_9EURO|nr:hypothetical protein OHC33_004746 [Knufia fluminis]
MPIPVATGAAPTELEPLAALDAALEAPLAALEAREAPELDALLSAEDAELLKLERDAGSVMEEAALDRLDAMLEDSLEIEAAIEDETLAALEPAED